MPLYHEVVAAAGETATKIIARRGRGRRTVVVTCNGRGTASVTWNDHDPRVTLNLPTLPPDSVLTRAEADRMVAYIAHECCHVIHTDWTAWTRAVMQGAEIKNLTNCLEDVRIERAEIRAGEFPALRTLLASLVTQKHAEAVTGAIREGAPIGSRVAHFPYVITILGRMANGYSVPTAHSLARDLCPPVRQLVDVALRELKTCRNTDQTRDLARRLLDMAKAMEPAPPAPADDDQGQKGQDGAGEAPGDQDGAGEAPGDQDGAGEAPGDQDGAGEAPGDQDGAGEAPGDQDGAGEAPGDQDGAGEAPGDQDGAGEAPGDQDEAGKPKGTDHGDPFDKDATAIDPDDLSQLTKAIADRYGEKGMEEFAQSNAHLLPLTRNRTDRVRNTRGSGNGYYANAMQALTGQTSVLHGQLARLLVSEEQRRQTHHETSGRLDRRALVRMRTGAMDVFSQREETPAVQTAVMILVDQSTSMGEVAGYHQGRTVSRLQMAVATGWALARAAEDAGGKVAVAGFRTEKPTSDAMFNGAILTVVKDFDEPCQTAAASVFSLQRTGSTPLSPAILEAARVLAGVNATRRITIALTDGECNFNAPAVTAACRIADDQGVETVGVGMACADVVKAFPDHYSVNVENLDQLAKTGLGTLVRMLEEAQEARR